jgi:hypothetical protein
VRDPTSQLRSATRRAKSDVANKLISMFLHELSRRASQSESIRVECEEYGELVRQCFDNRCPYCLCVLSEANCIVEHLDGLNRYRAGLHVPGNVLVACRKCNSEKRRDDSLRNLTLARSGWESFLSHSGDRCSPSCLTCRYWTGVWGHEAERKLNLSQNIERIRSFRARFPRSAIVTSSLGEALPDLLTKLYSDCQSFAESEISSLLEKFEEVTDSRVDVGRQIETTEV